MNAWIGPLETWFDQIALSTWPLLAGHEGLTLKLDAEDQHYLRFNAGRIRQATAVRQIRLRLDYQSDQRQCSHTLTLTGQIDHDRATVASTLDIMRQESRALPVDPWIIPLHHHGSSHIHHPGTWPEVARLVEDIIECGHGDDFAGLLALGTMVRANRNSLGQAHWYSSENLFFDYSLYTVNPDGENKAVKGFYAGSEWDQNRHKRLWVNQQDALKRLKQRNHTVSPGDYRVYLAPAAVEDLIGMCSWGGTSYRAFREGRSALGRLFENKTSFSPLFTLKENFTPGLAPRFNSLGELSPECLTIIDRGQPGSLLVSSRSAAEYGVDSNAAEPGSEGMRSPELMPGELEESQILKALGTGLY
ncbi:MAG: metallopeptidase TldD-related protein, partial [Methylococcaceae bacterium]